MKSINSKINQDITKYLKSIGLSNKQIKAGGYFSKKILDNFNTIIKNIVNEKK